jgi:hypothetical protein
MKNEGELIERGWRPLPKLLKLILALLVLLAIFSIVNIGSVNKTGYTVLGYSMQGISALFFALLFGFIGQTILIIGLWKRYEWSWKFGIGYFGFLIVDLIVNTFVQWNDAASLPLADYAISRMRFEILRNSIVGGAIYIVFLIIIYKKKSYFTKEKNLIK